ncbi:MAG: hypothetical protein JEZ06_13865 [Anaerolineaceae bacterium]|nr:hypothetical protein [Anaerolineaceae bacterium]
MNDKIKPWLFLSFPLAIFVGIAASLGYFDPSIYELDAPAYAIQGIGQDLATLVIAVPALLISMILAWRGSTRALLVNSGVQVYLFYSYSMYAITVSFNSLFLVYCLSMGLSFYGLIGILSNMNKEKLKKNILAAPNEKKIRRALAGLLFFSAAIFYFLWLSEIIPNLIAGTIPLSIQEVELPSNMVHVYDLAILLPALILSGIWLLRKQVYGFILAPILAIFSFFMAIALVSMVVIMVINGWSSDYSPAFIFSALAIINSVLSLIYLSALKEKPSTD